MAKTYYVSWPSTTTGDPRTNFGLSPTFVIFNNAGSAVSPPAISAVTGATGIYSFTWGTTTPIAFVIDGFTTGLGSNRYITGSIDPADRIDEIGATLVAIGTSNIALGTSSVALGTTAVASFVPIGTSLVAIGNSAIALGTSNIALGTTAVAIGTSGIALGNTILASITGQSAISALIGTPGSTFGGVSTDPIDLFGYLKRVQELFEGDNTYTKISGAWSLYNRGSSTLLRIKTITNSVSLVTKT